MADTGSRRILGFPNEFWIGFVILIGIFLKIVYNVDAGYAVSTHNLGEWKAIVDNIPNEGHLGVIQYYLTYHRLPTFDPALLSGYRTPPLFYIFSALILKIFYLSMGWELGTVLHCIQCLNAVFVMIGTFSGAMLLSKCGVRGRRMVWALMFLMFFSGFYNLGAAFDNTAMAYMFGMLSLNKMLRWYETRRRRDLITGAVMTALAMMTSLGMIVLAVPMGCLFVLAAVRGRYSEKKAGTPTGQAGHGRSLAREAGLYAAVALIPGLFYPIRNKVLFGTPLIGFDAEPEAWQNIGIYGPLQRLGLPEMASLRHLHLTAHSFYEYNIWGQTVKTAVADESALNLDMAFPRSLAVILVLAVFAFTVTALLLMIKTLADRETKPEHKLFMISGFLSILIGYVIICFLNPTISAMNFRKIALLPVFMLIGVGKGRDAAGDSLIAAGLSHLATGLILIISVLSAFLFGFYAV